MSGNRTPGSRSYSDFVDNWTDSVCIHQLKLKPRSMAAPIFYMANFGSFQLTHIPYHHHGYSSQVLMSNGSQKED